MELCVCPDCGELLLPLLALDRDSLTLRQHLELIRGCLHQDDGDGSYDPELVLAIWPTEPPPGAA